MLLVGGNLLLIMANIYLLHYNNYYNRIVKKFDALSGYYPYLINATPNPLININFNPNDGVSTELIINWSGDIPDYIVVSENGTSITSRWFVMEASRTRAKQFHLTLRRDVVVDNYDAIVNAPCYIDKAYVKDTDIAIFNKEAYKFNTIKQSETLLKDNTNTAWIVGYCSSKDITGAGLTGNVKAYVDDSSVQYLETNVDDYFSESIFTGLKGSSVSSHKKTFYGCATIIHPQLEMYFKPTLSNEYYSYIYSYDYTGAVTTEGYSQGASIPGNSIKELSNGTLNQTLLMHDRLRTASGTAIKNVYTNMYNAYFTYKNWNDYYNAESLIEEDGKIIKDQTSGKYYVINVAPVRVNAGEDTITSSQASVYQYFTQAVNSTTATVLAATGTLEPATNQTYQIGYYGYNNYEISLIEINIDLKYEIPTESNRQHLSDAPYDMFCMPFSTKSFYSYSVLKGQCNKYLNMAAAMSIASDLSGVGFLYDVQLLPYCPLDENYITADGNIDYKNLKVGTIYKEVQGQENDVLGWILFCSQSTFSFPLRHTINITNYKQQHQTDNWRFNSPNWSSSYDFDVTMNKGLSLINVDCTYKPYTPYIHLCPQFNSNGLYGYNNNDAVGLICSGDFSLPVVTDQWKTYEYQNKNYQNIFNRQIENINTNYRFSMIESGANALAGIGTGAISGAMMGGIPGAIAGAGASMIGAGADMIINKAKKDETVSFATDNFNYQIDNIKSLPNTLTKVSAFNNNNKLFPFIEYFSCTEQEKTIFNDLMTYQGMSVERVDKIANFVDTDVHFLRGRLIRLEDISEDTHMTSQIAQEIAKGVYI